MPGTAMGFDSPQQSQCFSLFRLMYSRRSSQHLDMWIAAACACYARTIHVGYIKADTRLSRLDVAAACALYIYNVLLTLDDEVTFVWKHIVRPVPRLLIAMKYLALISNVLSVFMALSSMDVPRGLGRTNFRYKYFVHHFTRSSNETLQRPSHSSGTLGLVHLHLLNAYRICLLVNDALLIIVTLVKTWKHGWGTEFAGDTSRLLILLSQDALSSIPIWFLVMIITVIQIAIPLTNVEFNPLQNVFDALNTILLLNFLVELHSSLEHESDSE
ncbi:hypothetical protein NM688_g6918 [Phlebia brevispora]|uniref:Uncharacterized protein n=1 Tax=Phlebia brevispora TaxID=194682 RepID=A0ACC1SBD4_9APHY|nr:hypothetical protein NM688_g6918 [Phlebia brevispora]